jgi:hypothetical protein
MYMNSVANICTHVHIVCYIPLWKLWEQNEKVTIKKINLYILSNYENNT